MKVIFLDIDGVLQPYNSGERFEHDSEKIVQELTDKKGIDYSQYYKIDVAAAYYDWDYSAVNTLRYILEQTDAKIVVSSDWRDIKRPYKVRDLLAIYNLDKYWIADTEKIEEDDIENSEEYQKYTYRTREIKKYLRKHPEVENYVAIDDKYLNKGLEGHFVLTDNLITYEQAKTCIVILNSDSMEEQIFERLTLNEKNISELKEELKKFEKYILNKFSE